MLVATLHPTPTTSLAAVADTADALELRLDHLTLSTVESLTPTLTTLGKPTLAALHGPEAFGTFPGPLDARFALLRAAAHAGAAFVDIDARFAAAFGPAPAGARRIVSHHEKRGTPANLAALFDTLERAALPGDVVKLVTHAACAEDGLRVLTELRARVLRDPTRERIAFCSGEHGAFTRILAPLAGSRFTYAPPDAAACTAPGQLPVAAVRTALASARSLRPHSLSATRWFAVLGRPVAHSWSPRLHGAVFRALGRDAVYVACEPDDVARFLALAHALPFEGFSVTAPFKSAALEAALEASEDARALGAANTLVRTEHGWRASNTDAPAVRAALELAGPRASGEGERARDSADSVSPKPVTGSRSLAGARALVVGAGGAARAAAWALRGAGARVAVHARRFDAAKELARALWLDAARDRARAHDAATGSARALEIDALDAAAVARERFDVVVHATPAGSRASADRCAVPAEWIAPNARVLDAVYRPRETELLRRARERGAVAIPGTTWFLLQARLQSALFLARLGAERIDPRALDAALASELEALLAEDDA